MADLKTFTQIFGPMDVLQYRSHAAAQFKCNALFRNDNRRDRDQCDQIWQNFTSLKKILEFILYLWKCYTRS